MFPSVPEANVRQPTDTGRDPARSLFYWPGLAYKSSLED